VTWGVRFPGIITVGTYHRGGDLVFWDIRDRNKGVVIDLRDEKYQRLVVEVDDPPTAVKTIQQALAGPIARALPGQPVRAGLQVAGARPSRAVPCLQVHTCLARQKCPARTPRPDAR
jgi:hypothetical protein